MTKKLSVVAMACMLSLGTMAQEKTMKAYMVADAHLDTQWNWDVQTTIRDHVRNTLTKNLSLFKKYPHYIFNFEGAVKYAWMKEYYPEMYEELKKYVANGRWHIAGSSWDANEVIIGSPESWIRNVTLGQVFYRQEFQKEGTDIFLPDCFGFGYTLPTLAAHCGLIGFSSQKLAWRVKPFYEDNKKYPFTVGLWQGIDGSRVMMTHGFGYGERWPDADLSKNEKLIGEIKESPLNMVYRYYGTGDIGGSPNLPSVRAVEKGIKGDGPVQIISATSDQMYKDFLPFDKHPELPVFDGELTMDLHGNGCYTSQAAMKLYNRQNEHLGDAAERSAVIADWLGQAKYPQRMMTETWQRVIWHQFHDDLTGTSIPRAYEFSWNDELLSLEKFSDILTHSVSAIASKMNTNVGGTPVVVYNNETFPVEAVAEVELATKGQNYQVSGPDGKRVASQVIERNGKQVLLFDAKVPATGLAVYSMKAAGKLKNVKAGSQQEIENSAYRVRVDQYGDIVSLFDKRAQKELVAQGKSIRLVVLDHCPSFQWPAWEIVKATVDKEPVPVHDGAEVTVERGPLRQTIVVKKRYGQSDIVQRIHLYEGGQAERVDFENEVEWHSSNALLKAEFPLSVSNEKATYDIGLGSVKRGNNQENMFEVYSHRWTDLTDRSGDYGVTVMNDSRYGWDKPSDNTIRLSLLYTPNTNTNYTYQSQQDQGHHVFTYSLVGHKGQVNEVKANQQSTVLNSQPKTFFATKHKGNLGRQFSFLSSDNENVMVRALKSAEVSDEYVVRVYELSGKQAQKAHLTFAGEIVKAAEADGTEQTIGAASYEKNTLTVDIKPYSVKTFKVKLRGERKTVVDAQPVQLAYDRNCFSYNEFRQAANFEGGFSYAAELLPDEGITADDIPFRFGEKDAASGMSCKGQSIAIPAEKTYRHLYLLVASDKDDRQATFQFVTKSKDEKATAKQTVNVPFYTGFIGQWGHDGHTKGFLKQANVAYVGTHRHSSNGDEPYEYTYMYKVRLDIPKDVKEVVMPYDEHVVVFAATFANDEADLVPAAPLFKSSLKEDQQTGEILLKEELPNLLKNATVLSVSGECNADERAKNLVDDNEETKWCDVSAAPNYVVFDLGEPTKVSRWNMVNAACEDHSYVTRTCLLQGRNSDSEEWKTLDLLDGNRDNVVNRGFAPVEVRYIRLMVISPSQSVGGVTRIYELGVY